MFPGIRVEFQPHSEAAWPGNEAGLSSYIPFTQIIGSTGVLNGYWHLLAAIIAILMLLHMETADLTSLQRDAM